MRKIETVQSRESKDKRNRMIIGITLIVLMVSSTIGFIFAFGGGTSSQNPNGEIEPDFNYKGIDFFRIGNNIRFQTIGYVFETSLEPSETESIEMGFDVNVESFFNKPLYYVYEEENSALSEINRNLGGLVLRSQRACIEGHECLDDLPLKDCSSNIIIIKISEKIKTYKEQNCIFLEGSEEQQLILADKLIYKALGIQ